PGGTRGAALPPRERPPRAGGGHRGRPQSPHRPGPGQPDLAAALRPRPRRHALELRGARGAADAPGDSRRAGRALRPRGMVPEEAPPGDPADGGVPPKLLPRPAEPVRRSGEPVALALEPAPPERRGTARRRPRRVRRAGP